MQIVALLKLMRVWKIGVLVVQLVEVCQLLLQVFRLYKVSLIGLGFTVKLVKLEMLSSTPMFGFIVMYHPQLLPAMALTLESL
jgi:hypothetical protein